MDNPVVSPSPLPAAPPPTLPVTREKSIIAVVLSVLFFLALLATVILAYQNWLLNQRLNAITATPSKANPPLAETPTPDPTANWKTYDASKFSFSYPENYTNQGVISGPAAGELKFVSSFSDPATIREGTDAPFDGFSLYYVDNLGDQDFQRYLQSQVQQLQNSPFVDTNLKFETTLIGEGQTASVLKIGRLTKLFYIPVSSSNDVVVFARTYANKSFIKTFDQILSTFQFTD